MFRHFILSIIFSLTVSFSTAIDSWQPYPITAVVTPNGGSFRIECSVYDSLLGSWQYYNSPYFSTTYINLVSNNAGIIAYNTFHTLPITFIDYRDQYFGYIIYDQELHQFVPEHKLYTNSQQFYNGAAIEAGSTSVNYMILHSSGGNDIYFDRVYIYDIIEHKWKIIFDDNIYTYMSSAYPLYEKNNGHAAINFYDDDLYEWRYKGTLYDPALHFSRSFYSNAGTIESNLNLDLKVEKDGFYYSLWPYDPTIDSVVYGQGHGMNNVDKIDYKNGIICLQNNTTGENRICIYDDLLHHWAVDTFYKSITKVKVKDRIIAYADTISSPQQVFYHAFSPTLRTWVSDSSTVSGGVDSIYIQNGTVYWVDLNSTTNFAGYIDSSGWGNYTTPLLLNFNLTDLTYINGEPIIFVRNYSIGTDSIWYDFGDGIVTDDFEQQSLWHLFKLNGHYGFNAQNLTLNVCIKANSPSGVQSSCQTYNQTFCSIAGNITLSSNSICLGDSVLLSTSGYTGNIQWQISSGAFHWVDLTGPGANTDSFMIAPSITRRYRAKVTNGICAPAYSEPDTILVSFSPIAGTMSSTIDSICNGGSAYLSLTGSTGAILWQSNYGSGWVNETGSGNNSPIGYLIQPTSNVQIQVIASFGACAVDTSNIISINVVSISDPVTINDTLCGSGIVNLSATGSGVLNWFESSTGLLPVFSGNNFSPALSSTTTWYVQSGSGNNFSFGAADTNIGTLDYYNGSSKYGLQFEVNELSMLDVVYVYPRTTGTLTVYLANAFTGNILDRKDFPVVGNSGKTPLITNFNLSPNLIYKIYINSSSPQLYYNSTGATYPMTSPGSPVTITGYYNPNLQTGSSYYFFYDWKISQGCKSNFVPVTGVVTSFTTPVVNASGPLSFCQGGNVILSTNTGTGYAYQWYRNGLILAGETGFSYTAYSPGSYTVSVFDSACGGQMLSTTAYVSVPCVTPFDPQLKESFSLETPFMITSYNLSNQSTSVNAQNLKGTTYIIKMFDVLGKEIYSSNGVVTKDGEIGVVFEEIDCTSFAEGYYTIHLQTDLEKLVKKFVKGK